MAFQCSVATPEGLAFDETVTSAVLPAHDGEVGILTDRAPVLVQVGAGTLKLSLTAGRTVELFVAGGVAQMVDNVLTVLTDEATAPEKLDVAAARATLADDQQSAGPVVGDAAMTQRRRRVDRAKAVLRVTGNAA